MAQELVYTSAPNGLRLGSAGFCTVACTRGMAPNYMELLESLSAYTAFYPLSHPDARLNPTAHSHYRFIVGGRPVHVLSRVAFAGADYSQRSNKIAHHVALDTAERSDGGPAWVMRQPGFFVEQWAGEPAFVDTPKRIPAGDAAPAPCETWARVTGDAGWAGVLAQAFCDDPRTPSFIIFEPGAPVLDLAAEALALLPVGERWNVTFNTYFTTLPIGTACCWRFCLPNAEALRVARGTAGALTLDLRRGPDQPPEARRWLAASGALVSAARTGRPAEPGFGAAPPAAAAPAVSSARRGPRLALEREPAWTGPAPEAPAAPARPGRRGRWLWGAALAVSLAANAGLVLERVLRQPPSSPAAKAGFDAAEHDWAGREAELVGRAAQEGLERKRLEEQLEDEKSRADKAAAAERRLA
nr:hypothetical protein [Candidatus Brocadiia bacterium]